MADGHFPDVELLRRELAALILEWAGKAVNDDPNGPMSTALTRAVSEAARGAVAEQHQILTAEAADQIAAALERRGKVGALFDRGVPAWSLGVVAVVAAALVVVAFLLGVQTGRTEGAPQAEPAPAATGSAPVAPLAPAASEPARPAPARHAEAAPSPARPRATAASVAKPAAQPPPHALGRPATAHDEASSRSAQPVGAATTTTTAPTAPTAAVKP